MAFEDKTFESIQEAMREEANLEGSMIDVATARMALRLEEAYEDLDAVNDNMLVDTQDRDHLIDSGAECGLPLIEGKPASVRAVMNCQCEIGSEFTAVDSEFNYVAMAYLGTIVIDDVTWYRYEMEADENGIEAGEYRGDIEPLDDVEGFEEGQIDATISPGTEDEETEDYRDRRLNAFTSQACAGNREYYHDIIHDNVSGVGGIKSARRTITQGETGYNSSVGIWVQGADYGVADASLIAEIDELMDPDDMDGEGMGLNPFGSILTIESVTGVNIAVTATITCDTGYTFDGLKTEIETAVDAYLATIREGWEDNYNERWELAAGEIVRVARIEAAILTVEGVLDVADVAINGTEANLQLENTEIPILTGVNENG
jgi:uncharacterized phage protein gp47/JayE